MKMSRSTTCNLLRSYIMKKTLPTQIRHSASLAKLKRLQAHFQAEDGKPIWLKNGLCDRILYTSTVVGSVLGTVMVIACLYDNIKPESWKVKE